MSQSDARWAGVAPVLDFDLCHHVISPNQICVDFASSPNVFHFCAYVFVCACVFDCVHVSAFLQLCVCMGLHGCAWVCMGVHGCAYAWVFMGVHGCAWSVSSLVK